MYKGILAGALVALAPALFAQSFEGVIEFTKSHGKVSTTYKYHVKGDNIRIEEIGDEGEVYGIQLVNTETDEVWGISPEKNMYMEVTTKSEPNDPDTDVKETEIFVTLNGTRCNEVDVTCAEEETMITYYVADGNYAFFVPMLETLKRKDKQAVYYLEIDSEDGQFPMKSIERKTDGTLVSALEVTSISEESVDDSMFEIPEEYQMFDRGE